MPDPKQDSSLAFSYPPGWGEMIKEEKKATPFPAPISDSVTTLHIEEKSKSGLIKKFALILLVLLALAAIGIVVFKFLLPRFEKPGEATLNYWGLWEPSQVMGGILSEWEKKHPDIKINYTQHSHRDYRERVQSALARNEGPDIFRFHIAWLPMLKNELDTIPSSVMSTAEFEKTYYPVMMGNLRSGRGYLGIPLEVDTLALFYNQEILQAAGKTPPNSWSELRKLAVDLTTRDETGQIQTAGVALGTAGNVVHWSDILGLMMLQNGADLTDPSSNLAEDGLTFYTIFSLRDRVWNERLPNSTLAFATGKVAMYFGYSWDVFDIKAINPSLDFKIIPVPQLPGADITWASFWVEGVAKKSKHQQEAWEFLKFLSSPEIMEKLYLAESQIRLFGEPYARVEMAEKLAGDPMVWPFLQQAPKAQTWYLCSRTWDNGINDRMIKYFEDAVNAVNSGIAPAEALVATANGVSQLLSQYGLTSKIGQ